MSDDTIDRAPVMRPRLAGGAPAGRDTAFTAYIRSGATVEMKAFTGVTGNAGGYAIPTEIDAVIDRTLASISPIRAVANVVRVGSAGFRPQGRDPAWGLDCVGLVARAAGIDPVPADYALRGGDAGSIAALIDGFARRVAQAEPGDILLLAVGAAQFHLAVATGEGIIHADAGLRRVVERPGPPPWPVLGIWRID